MKILHSSASPSIWNKDFTLHLLANFLLGLSFYFLLISIPVIAVNFLGANNSQAGFLVGSFTLAALIIRPFAGYALDTYGRKRIFLLTIIFFTLATFGYSLVSGIAFFLFLRLFHGLVWGVLTTSSPTIAADIVPPEKIGEGIGYFGLSIALSMALGPMIALHLMDSGQYKQLFAAAGIPALIALAAAAFVTHPTLSFRPKAIAWGNFFEKRVSFLCVTQFFVSFTYGGLLSFLALYCAEINVSNGGIFFLWYALSMSITRPLSGKIMDSAGPGKLVSGGFVCIILGYFLLWACRNTPVFILAAVFIGLGNGLLFPSMQTMVVKLVEPQARGVANSTFSSTVDLGIGTGSILMGWLADGTSIATMFLFCGLLNFLPLLFFHIFTLRDYNYRVIKNLSK